MVSTKQIRSYLALGVLTLVALLSFAYSSIASATDDEAPQPDQTALDNISQNCASIKQSLKQLQRADSRTRTYLGAAYQNVLGNFIAPLNLRLARNNLTDTNLTKIQTEFVAAQDDFRNNYTEYMRNLESLIATDCQAHPQDFYDQLVTTRSSRLTLQTSATRLAALVQDQITAVAALQEAF